MRIILADPPLKELDTSQTDESPNLGVLCLISALKEKIDELEIYYLEIFHDMESHLKEIDRIKPDFYGISFASFFMSISYQVINAIKEKHPSLPVVCGGAHATVAYEDIFKKTKADICCLGEGEITIVELVKCYMSGGDLKTVDGIVYRDGSKIIRNSNQALVENLNTLPYPAWDLIDFSKYSGFRRYRGTPSTAIVVSRGCPFNCTFCSNPVWKLLRPWVRMRSPQNIAGEVEYLYNRGIREIYLRSDEMNPDIDWCIKVFEALSQLGHKELYFQCNLRAKPINEELAKALVNANCWMISLGIESANQRVLNGMKKHVTVNDIKNACQILKKYKIKVFGFLMMYIVWEEDDKLCIETPKEVDNTLFFLLKLRLRNMVYDISWHFATPYPNTEFYRVAEKYNLLTALHKSGKLKSELTIPLNVPEISTRRKILSRTIGLLIKGLFALTSKEYYHGKIFWSNIRYGGQIVKQMFGIIKN